MRSGKIKNIKTVKMKQVRKSYVYRCVFFWYSYLMGKFDFPKLRRDVFTVASVFDRTQDKSYWFSKSPYERLEAVELMRQIIYGYNPSTTRLQRVFEAAERA
jgi:hypothetical protein